MREGTHTRGEGWDRNGDGPYTKKGPGDSLGDKPPGLVYRRDSVKEVGRGRIGSSPHSEESVRTSHRSWCHTTYDLKTQITGRVGSHSSFYL